MNSKQIVVYLLLTIVVSTLINNSTFGLQTLAACFYYTLAVSVCSMLLLVGLLVKRQKYTLPLPIYLLGFYAFCGYVNIHGLVTGTYGLPHLIWLSSAIFFTTVHVVCVKEIKNTAPLIQSISNGILVIALFETAVVILQASKIIRSKDDLFVATGTWVNPNVTAIFLSLSIYFVLRSGFFHKKRIPGMLLLVLIILAIVLLQCRTASLVAIIAIWLHYQQDIRHWIHKQFPGKGNIIMPVLVAAGIIISGTILFNVKKNSTSGRLQVYKNSIGLIQEQPWLGRGFGRFERQYNYFVAQHHLPSNGHVNMAYNDFIELMVEGGIVAVVLWAGWLIAAGVYNSRHGYSLFPVLALLIIQLTNFAFQATPVMTVLILSIAFPFPLITAKVPLAKTHGDNGQVQLRFPYSRGIVISVVVISTALLIYQLRITAAFRDLNKIPEKQYKESIDAFEALEDRLQGQPIYHEKFGDAWLQTGDFIKATSQYQQALAYCSYPSLLAKCGFSYQLQNNYDSSLYYYTLARNIEPFRFITQVMILKMYEQKKDTLQMMVMAREIMKMPVKVENQKAARIKRYAGNLLMKIK